MTTEHQPSPIRRFLQRFLVNHRQFYGWLRLLGRRLSYTANAFIYRGLADQVSSLSFSTLFALVPLAAVLLAIARGFGFGSYLESQFREFLQSQPEAADFIIKFANNYLSNNQNYIVIGAGFLFILYTVVNLFRNIEETFNGIWQVEESRGFQRMIIDYSALTLLFTVALIVSAGLTVYVGGVANSLVSIELLRPAVKMLGVVFQIATLWLAFLFLYTFMPNVKVRLAHALWPAFWASVLLVLFQYVYAVVQYFLSSYDAVYGSLAILPLFMLSVMIGWYICLFGAELTFINQFGADLESFGVKTSDLKHSHYLLSMLLLLATMTRRNREGSHPDLSELSAATGVPVRLAQEMVNQLVELGLAHQVGGTRKDEEVKYAVDLTVAQLQVGEAIDLIESKLGRPITTPRFEAILSQEPLKQLLKAQSRYTNELLSLRIGDWQVDSKMAQFDHSVQK
jgi:membrane protein